MDQEESDKDKVSHESGIGNWHEPHKGQLVQDADSTKLSLPPHLYKKGKDISSSYRLRLVAIFLVIVGVVAGFLGGWLGADVHDQNSSIDSPTTSEQTVVSSQAQVINRIAKNVGQSVVSVLATSQSAVTPNLNSLLGGTVGSGSQQDAGTGIIISSNGLIITNRHVIPVGTTNVSI